MTDIKRDVVAVNMETNKIEILARSKTERNAEAIVNMAIMRRGVETHFYSEVPVGKYKEGDDWTSAE
jgi:hypothetical protein